MSNNIKQHQTTSNNVKRYAVSKPDRTLTGTITLDGSKSIANRVLIVRALSGADFPIERMAGSRDTETLQRLLASDETTLDAGAAGTTFRFLTAYLALQPGEQTLTGSERMKQRPIGVLVDALRELGADIGYLENEGYPPLRIGAGEITGGDLTISAGTSSQYISALLLIAPTLPKGLNLTLDGKIVSRPYIDMTLNIMAYFGAQTEWEDQTIRVAPTGYTGRPFRVEADWSAASYWYLMAAFADKVALQLDGLYEQSVQGDQAIANIMRGFGIQSTYNDTGVLLEKSLPPRRSLDQDFLRCPDLAQSVAVACAGTGTGGMFTGLETLRIKETDRIAALQTELAKIQVYLSKLPPHLTGDATREYFMLEGEATFAEAPTFPTYEDHRMAMAFAPLGMLHPVAIEEPEVVVKSYPAYWDDLRSVGFEIGEL